MQIASCVHQARLARPPSAFNGTSDEYTCAMSSTCTHYGTTLRNFPFFARNGSHSSQRKGLCRAASTKEAATTTSFPAGNVSSEGPAEDGALFVPEDWANCFQSQDEEFDYCISDVEGVVPEDLKGTLFRVCPGSMEIGDAKCEHWLDGDGYAMAFVFEGGSDGCVTFRSRYVETPERLAEQDAGKVLYRNTFGTQPEGINTGDISLKNPANTNVVLWGGKLLALWEAGSPFELDPNTLETRGTATLDGWIRSGSTPTSTGSQAIDSMLGFGDAHTAHPHVVETVNGPRLVTWKWNSVMRIPGGTSLQAEFREYDEDWSVTSTRKLEIPSSPMAPHDFAVTESSYVLTIPPMKLNILPYLAGMAGPAQCVSLAKGPMRVYVCPRDEPELEVQAINEEAIYYIHYANAFDDGEDTVLQGSAWGPDEVAKLAANPRDGILGSWDDLMQGNFTAPVTNLWEHRINRKTGSVTRRLLFKQSMDHPRVNPAFYGRKNRFVYFNNCAVPFPHDQSGPPQMWTRLDLETGEAQQVYFGSRFFTEELIFVPREGSDTREDWGYLLGMMYCAENNRTALVVMDASDFNKGALCKIWLDDPFPHGLHGFFTPQVYH